MGRRMSQHLQRRRLHLAETWEESGVVSRKGFFDLKMSPRLAGLLNVTVGQEGSKDSVALLFLIMGKRSRKIFLILWVPGKNVVVRFKICCFSDLGRGVY